jgi:hypothetical protein
MPLLQMMAAHLPQVVAISHGKVIGYNLAMPVAMKDAMPSLISMFTEFEPDSTELRGGAHPLSTKAA